MLRRLQVALIVPLIVLLAGCTVGHRITRLASGVQVNPGDQAAYYALPRTVITVSFPVTKAEVKEGTGKYNGKACFDELGDAADFDLPDDPMTHKPPALWQAIGLDELPTTTSQAYKVNGTPTISSLSEPDPEQVFRVDLSSSWAIKRELNLTYGPTGVLQSGTSFVQDRRVDLSVGLLKAVVGTATSLRSLVAVVQPQPMSQGGTQPFDCATLEDPCQRAACETYQARQKLSELSQTVIDEKLSGKQAEWLEKRYRDDIDKRVSLFVRQSTEKANVVCAVRPATWKSGSGKQGFEVLQLDKTMGFHPGKDADCLIPYGFLWTSGQSSSVAYALQVVPASGQYEEYLAGAGVPQAHDDTKPQGFYYRVPAIAAVSVEKGPEVLVESDILVAQLGFVAALPGQRTYQTKYMVTLDPATGALQTLDSNTAAISPDLITSSGTAIADALDKRAEAKKDEAAAKDELALLQRERMILEEKQKIRNLQKDLGETEPPNL